MNITLKLFATLGDYLPPEAKFNQLEVELAEGATVGAVIDRYALPPKFVHLVLVNGVYVSAEDRAARVLTGGDVLAIWPPIAGG
jgi:sulfur carrier protein ThiS